MATSATVLIVPGLRDQVAQHWQTLLETRLRAQGQAVCAVAPMGREKLDCARYTEALEAAACAVQGPLVLVAHSGGCVIVAHWAQRTQRAVRGALLATPPDFDKPMPEGYPALEPLRAGGWFPVPRAPLPFTSIVAASRNDPLASYDRAVGLAKDWGSTVVDLGEVGHLNPASGFGEWPQAETLIAQLLARDTAH